MTTVPESPAPVLVIIPTYNERENLPRIVPIVLRTSAEAHVLVVDDASPDGTGAVADDLAAHHPERVHVLHREGKAGLGPAYLAGFRWALDEGYAAVLQMDADLSHPPAMIPTMVGELRRAGVDFVVGSRYMGGRVTVVNWPMGRLLISYFGNAYARFVTRLPISDATGGFNLYADKALQALPLDRIASTGYTFQIELKLRAWVRGFRFAEVPIVFTERDHGESKMSKRIVLEAVWKVWKLRALAILGRL